MSSGDAGIKARILLLGERQESELPWCVAYDLTVCVNDIHGGAETGAGSGGFEKRVPVHVKINSGMTRYGVLGRGVPFARHHRARAVAAIGRRHDALLPVR